MQRLVREFERLGVEPLSLLISGVWLCEGRTASDSEPVFGEMKHLVNLISDGGSGLLGAGKKAGPQMQRDLFHGLRKGAACLGREVARTLAWRRKDKTAASVLRRASTDSVADAVELAILEAVDHAVRSSSSVECVNSRVRLAQAHLAASKLR